MEFLLGMSIVTSAAGVSVERAKAQEWMRAWVTRVDVKKDAAASPAAEQGRPQQQQQNEARALVKRPQEKKTLHGGPSFAPEFDGLNCFETIVFR